MVCVGAVSILLFCLALISQVQAQAQVFIVKYAPSGNFNGIYAKEGQGYTRMGGADDHGQYCYLYRGTGIWAIGYATSFEDRQAWFRAPAGGEGDRLPPEKGWQDGWDNLNDRRGLEWGKDGYEGGESHPGMSVTGFNLKEATADEMYKRGGEQTADGILCNTGEKVFRGEQWTHIRWTDDQFCDGTKNCMNGLDEPEGCQRVVVTGSNGMDGLFKTRTTSSIYKQEGGTFIIFNDGGRWKLGKGLSPEQAVVHYGSGESELLPANGWQDVFDQSRREGKD